MSWTETWPIILLVLASCFGASLIVFVLGLVISVLRNEERDDSPIG